MDKLNTYLCKSPKGEVTMTICAENKLKAREKLGECIEVINRNVGYFKVPNFRVFVIEKQELP